MRPRVKRRRHSRRHPIHFRRLPGVTHASRDGTPRETPFLVDPSGKVLFADDVASFFAAPGMISKLGRGSPGTRMAG